MIPLCFRGELYYADLGHGVGSEQEGYRPVLVVQNDVGNLYSPTTIIVPISRQNQTKAKLPTHYPLEAIAGLSQPSIVLLEQVRVIDKNRLEKRIGILPKKYMRGVEKALKISIGLTPISTKKPIYLCSTCANRIRGTGVFLIRTQSISEPGSERCISCSQEEGVEYEIADTPKR